MTSSPAPPAAPSSGPHTWAAWILGLASGLCLVIVAGVLITGDDSPREYLVALGLAAGAMAWIARRPSDLRTQAAVTLLLFVGGLYALETVLIFSDRVWLVDRRTKAEVILDLRAQGQDAWPTVPPSSFYRAAEERGPFKDGEIPLAGISDVTTVYSNESGFWVVYPSDEHGFNNPRPAHQQPVDIVVVGDSFAHGAGVEPDDCFPAQLRASGRSVLNLGYAGNGPLMELATLREYAAPLRPRHVIWAFFEGNDLRDLDRERLNPVLMRYLHSADSRRLRQKQPRLNALLRKECERKLKKLQLRPDKRRLHSGDVPLSTALLNGLQLREIRDGLERRLDRMRGQAADPEIELPDPEATTDAHPDALQLLPQVLRTAQREVAVWGGQLHILYLPEWRRFEEGKANDTSLEHRGDILRIVHEANLPLIDGATCLGADPDPLRFFPRRQSGHYTAEGHAALARALNEALGPP